MPQSMVAVLALMLFSLFAVQQQQRVYVTQNNMIRQAISSMLNGAAVERLEEIAATAYDQKVSDNETLTSSSELSDSDTFGPGNDAIAEDDVDDFHTATDTLYRAIGTDSLGFVVYSEIQYASESNPEQPATTGHTKYKLVAVTARSLTLPDLPEVRVHQSVSCGSACQW